ncbi:MAG TPA: NCS2 family permease [Anaerohalosphaeraceae bacterium]|nr:NCS2 family permease [Phycisphaerae bacterium]HOK95719.1 NCS2 family permease [Anaerohalosphaeraceae bacterium]HOL31638.1 NCS2 family permease [Anaerohalosphaeraceae bacterium]HOM75900.1 NCS2 family permease [Anaerohalosphaeraceae bacterium]HPC63729.1 NCS2 family permease [Anaerohalosphaeraceae bacterium]
MVKPFFDLQAHQTTVKTEVIAGFTTFLTMAYIIFVNPNILAEAGMDKSALIAVTCLVTAVSTIATGLLANAPIAMAPGMGLNAFFAYTLVLTRQVTWQTALAVVFLSGLFFLILTLAGLRKKLVEAIPQSLTAAISVGIGLFITFIGLQNLGLIVAHPVTLVTSAHLTPTILVGLAGLAVMIIFEMRRIPGALLIGIAFSTALAALLGYISLPQKLVSININILPTAFKMDFVGALKWGMFSSIFTLMFIDMFDSIGTLLAVAPQAKLVDAGGKFEKLDRLLTIDAAATMFGAVCGTSTTTSYIESAAGIAQGGRTGLTAVVTGILFLAAMLFVPLAGIVPNYATAPALIMVGLFMTRQIRLIDFSDMQQGLPAFIIMVMIALSYSISTGLAFGFITYTLIEILTGKFRNIKPAMWVIAVLSVLYFCV